MNDETFPLTIWSTGKEAEEMEWPCLEMNWQIGKKTRLGGQRSLEQSVIPHSAPLSCYVQFLYAKVTYQSPKLDSRSKQDRVFSTVRGE